MPAKCLEIRVAAKRKGVASGPSQCNERATSSRYSGYSKWVQQVGTAVKSDGSQATPTIRESTEPRTGLLSEPRTTKTKDTTNGFLVR